MAEQACDYFQRSRSLPTLTKALMLFGSKSERLELPIPFGRQIAKPLDADAAGQATFHCGFDKVGAEEGERDGHVDLPNAASLSSAKLSNRGHST